VIESITASQIFKRPNCAICPVFFYLTAWIRVHFFVSFVAILTVPKHHTDTNLAISAREALGKAKAQIEAQFGWGDFLLNVVQIESRNLAEDVFRMPPPHFDTGRRSKVDHVDAEEHGEQPTQNRSMDRVIFVRQADRDAKIVAAFDPARYVPFERVLVCVAQVGHTYLY